MPSVEQLPGKHQKGVGSFREDNDFADMTLACEDGQQVEAHKVILAASSPFFQKLLGGHKHPHPLVFMRGVKSDDLLAIMDFVYKGEANVSQENLSSFLSIAEELQLKGLVMGKTENNPEQFQVDLPSECSTTNTNANISKSSFYNPISNPEENQRQTILENFSGNLRELDERVKSMMEKSQNRIEGGKRFADLCKVCGKEGFGGNIKEHIEANHLEGVVVPCRLCTKTFRSRNLERQHNNLGPSQAGRNVLVFRMFL